MSAEILRRAAALMRERAEVALAMREQAASNFPNIDMSWPTAENLEDNDWDAEDADHIASWHPTVALAVADWLDGCASVLEVHHGAVKAPAIRVARAYLGESA